MWNKKYCYGHLRKYSLSHCFLFLMVTFWDNRFLCGSLLNHFYVCHSSSFLLLMMWSHNNSFRLQGCYKTLELLCSTTVSLVCWSSSCSGFISMKRNHRLCCFKAWLCIFCYHFVNLAYDWMILAFPQPITLNIISLSRNFYGPYFIVKESEAYKGELTY